MFFSHRLKAMQITSDKTMWCVDLKGEKNF